MVNGRSNINFMDNVVQRKRSDIFTEDSIGFACFKSPSFLDQYCKYCAVYGLRAMGDCQ